MKAGADQQDLLLQLKNMDQLPIILEIANLPPNAELSAWQSELNSYLSTLSTPDAQVFWHNQELTGMTVDAVRELVAEAAFGNLDKPQFHVILAAETNNQTAQNAMLKMLEEPPKLFLPILATRLVAGILPTIQSRCQVLHWKKSAQRTQSNTLQPSQSLIRLALLHTSSQGALSNAIQTYKDRPTAIALLESELNQLHQSAEPPSPQVLKSTLHCWQVLQQNANVALALEQWLFSIHQSQSTRQEKQWS